MRKRTSMPMVVLLSMAFSVSVLMAQDRQDTIKVKASTQNPHGIISIACDACHATGDWKITKKDMAFDHNTQTGFPLEGQHRSGDCKACHANYQFAGSKTECYDCHNDIHKGQLGKQCDQCHTSKSWQPFNFKVQHDLTRFPLTGKHATADCQSCHINQQQNEFKGLTTVCSGCHLTDYNSSTNPNHAQYHIPLTCETCHTPQGWFPARIIDHSQFGFELTQGHGNIDCAACHSNGNYAVTGECYSCHKTDYDRSNDPEHLVGNYSTNCLECHTTSAGWSPAKFDHAVTAFPLTGAHVAEQDKCASCHTGGFMNTQTLCNSCHTNDFDQANDPDHVSGNYSRSCEQCHTTNSGWKPATFDHNVSQFPLTGGHLAVQDQCQKCHSAGYNNTPLTCYGCHQQDFLNATAPVHVAGSFSTNCEQCHTTNPGWKPATFDHSTTSFPLTGAHLAVQNECIICHASGFVNTPTDCYACHQQDFANTTNPNHIAGNYSTNCLVCHSTNPGWQPVVYNHNLTNFPLTGAHLPIQNQCTSCHINGYVNTPSACFSCHLSAYNSSTNPSHQTLAFPTDCGQCHTTNAGWRPSTFDHNTTQFQLTGAHLTVSQCAQCHTTGLSGTNTTCYSCHQTAFNNAANPAHQTLGFPTNCEQCHTTNMGWRPSTFDHNTTQFPLTGAHVTVAAQCVQCHTTSLAGTGTACYSCHQTEYSTAASPNHAASAFPTSCEQCHTTNPGWTPSTFDHNTTQFQLTGAHLTVANQCNTCHTSSLAGTSTVCYSCHQAAYNGSVNPNHPALAFPTNCEQCHTTNAGWRPSTFDHNTTQFQLTGAHLLVASQCVQCHATGLSGTSTACYSCHQAAYNGSTNPGHQTLAFPTACEQCHTTNSGWKPSTFDHNATQFPLTGAHLSVANQCAQCHTTSLAGTSTACYSCHQTVFTGTTDPNHVTNNFPTDCSLCHTTNLGWIPAAFDHNTTAFPLTGAHLTVASQCISCHASGYVNTPTDCYACHQADYNNAANPNHASNIFPTNCTQCHTTNAGWKPSTFDHNTTQFPLTGAHLAVGNQCISCHSSGYVNTPTLCYACHQTDYDQAVSPNHSALSFPTTCQNGCHSTTGWSPSTFSHGTYTTYTLLGAHQAIAGQCDKCHTGNLTSANTACYSCHQNDYNSSTKPNHTGSGFSQDCQNCHNQNVWIPWTVNHDAQHFPINSGKHGGEWTGCGGGSGNGAGCHTNDTDWRLYSCIHCHEHDLTSTNEHHAEVKDYLYSSPACFTCHPQGTSGFGKLKKFNR